MKVSPCWVRSLGTRFAVGGSSGSVLMLDECSCPRGDPAGIVGPVLTAGYRELLTAVARSSAALTGLLFVAISVRPGSTAGGMPPVIRQVRAATSLLAFTNMLVVS